MQSHFAALLVASLLVTTASERNIDPYAVNFSSEPFVLVLAFDDRNSGFCTGTLVASAWVLTAASCVRGNVTVLSILGVDNIDDAIKYVPGRKRNDVARDVKNRLGRDAEVIRSVPFVHTLFEHNSSFALNNLALLLLKRDMRRKREALVVNEDRQPRGRCYKAVGFGRWTDRMRRKRFKLKQVADLVDRKLRFEDFTDLNLFNILISLEQYFIFTVLPNANEEIVEFGYALVSGGVQYGIVLNLFRLRRNKVLIVWMKLSAHKNWLRGTMTDESLESVTDANPLNYEAVMVQVLEGAKEVSLVNDKTRDRNHHICYIHEQHSRIDFDYRTGNSYLFSNCLMKYNPRMDLSFVTAVVVVSDGMTVLYAGTLIAREWVLATATGIDSYWNDVRLEISTVIAIFKAYDLSPLIRFRSDSFCFDFCLVEKLERIFRNNSHVQIVQATPKIHPGFKRHGDRDLVPENNLALLKLYRPVDIDSISLGFDDVADVNDCRIAGWGHVVDFERYRKFEASVTDLRPNFSPSDIGGPLLCNGKQYGLVSFFDAKPQREHRNIFHVMYTLLGPYKAWIYDTIQGRKAAETTERNWTRETPPPVVFIGPELNVTKIMTCAGTLIAPGYVLTVTRCLLNLQMLAFFNASDVTSVVARYDTVANSKYYLLNDTVQGTVVIHPSSGVGLIKLNNPSKALATMEISDELLPEGSRCKIVGLAGSPGNHSGTRLVESDVVVITERVRDHFDDVLNPSNIYTNYSDVFVLGAPLICDGKLHAIGLKTMRLSGSILFRNATISEVCIWLNLKESSDWIDYQVKVGNVSFFNLRRVYDDLPAMPKKLWQVKNNGVAGDFKICVVFLSLNKFLIFYIFLFALEMGWIDSVVTIFRFQSTVAVRTVTRTGR